MLSFQEVEKLKPFQARAIIEALRKGTVPMEYVPLFTVGRENWLTFIVDDLENYIAEGGAKVRFIIGDYGDGKTHFMSVIRHLGFEKKFAVSFVVLTREVPIHKFEVVYQNIVQNIVGTFEGKGIRNLIENWLKDLEQGPIKGKTVQAKKELAKLLKEIRDIEDMDTNFANGLIALLNNRFSPLEEDEDEESRDIIQDRIYHWLEGGKVTKRELKPFQIYEIVNKANSKNFLSSLIAFLRYLNYKGLILLLDEMETVIAQSASIRNASYENIRLLIDNTEQAKYLHIFCSIIPDVLISEKGFKSYDALWSRVRSIGETKQLNYRGVLVDIHRTPLQTQELVNLGTCLRDIHEISYRWSAKDLITDKIFEQICNNQKKMGILSEIRLFIKQIIRTLDMAEQGVKPENIDLTEQIIESQKEIDAEKVERFQPSWDS